eukprot:TRINITY_DN40089_c0_g1_i1.p1 TRINITY_DN40089_c0_g1~~TRINITY_DN40089_c0_g1_i1.p1  ORF type:complete len:193 (+),score=51.57 TRINITY_DN40089_c0_g1_i1:144-722(+)
MTEEAQNPNSGSPSTSSSEQESSDSDSEDFRSQTKRKKIGEAAASRDTDKKEREARKSGIDFDALKRYGYSGGPSVLNVPPPKQKEPIEQDWSWSTGNRKRTEEAEEETYEERQKTRHAVLEGAALSAAQAIAERNLVTQQRREIANEQRRLSFSRKEKRKRDLGQASRGKNYVEEEKRLLRDQGIYSGFDS